MLDIYKEIIMDHYQNPRNCGFLSMPDFSYKLENPLCGDSVVIQGRLEGNQIKECRFKAQGCVISQASASLLLEHVSGKNTDEIHGLSSQSMMNLLGTTLGPTRLKCALLPLEALKKGLADYA